MHSTAFRRLEDKTQVFVSHEGDHFRTRLTHTLEVAQIARTAARALGLDEDLAEAVALAHDLGHSPFGHAGEDALDAALAAHGGFDHNAQTLRVITCLERRYAEFDGLNLTWETLEGVVKHNGPLRRAVPRYVAEYCAEHDLELDTHASAEAQIAALADDIAYCNHDLDDGLRAGLFTVDDLAGLPLVGGVFAEVATRYPEVERARLINESRRRLISHMVVDMVEETARRLAALRPADVGGGARRTTGRWSASRRRSRSLSIGCARSCTAACTATTRSGACSAPPARSSGSCSPSCSSSPTVCRRTGRRAPARRAMRAPPRRSPTTSPA